MASCINHCGECGIGDNNRDSTLLARSQLAALAVLPFRPGPTALDQSPPSHHARSAMGGPLRCPKRSTRGHLATRSGPKWGNSFLSDADPQALHLHRTQPNAAGHLRVRQADSQHLHLALSAGSAVAAQRASLAEPDRVLSPAALGDRPGRRQESR